MYKRQHLLEAVKEALDEVALTIDPAAEDEGALAYRARRDVDPSTCLLYTSDAADDMQCVDLGGRRIIKKKKRA